MKGLLMNSGWRPKRSFIGQINDFWTSVTNVFPQNPDLLAPKKADKCLYMLRMLHMCACNIKTKKNGNWLGPVMNLFGRLLDLSLENNAFPAALMDLFQKISSRLIKLTVTARPNLSWHYGMFEELLLSLLPVEDY
jgi:hypothetical protein